MAYRLLLRPLLFLLPAETAHRLVFATLRLAARLPLVLPLLRLVLVRRNPVLRTRAFGLYVV